MDSCRIPRGESKWILVLGFDKESKWILALGFDYGPDKMYLLPFDMSLQVLTKVC